MQVIQSRLRLTLVAALAGASAVVLVATPPHLSSGWWARGDDLALASAWSVALAAGVWLFAASTTCLVAISAHRPQLARTAARALPPGLRRAAEIVVVASCLAVSATPAHAAHRTPAPVIDQPVVRAPRSLAVSPTTRLGAPSTLARPEPGIVPRSTPAPSTEPSPRPTPTTATTTTAAPRAEPRPAAVDDDRPSPVDRPPVPTPPTAPPGHGSEVVVRPGDNLWSIARTELVRGNGEYPDDAQVARYWRAVIDANRATLRSGNPGLIFPGEIVTLPVLPPVS